MKKNNLYLLAAALLAVAFTGCKNDEYDNKSPFDNVVYLNVSENSDTQVTTFKKTLPDLPKTFSVVLSYPASQAVSIGVATGAQFFQKRRDDTVTDDRTAQADG